MESTSTPSANKTTNVDTQRTIEAHVEANALNLTLSALSAALGDIKVLRLTRTNKNSLKYTIVKDEDELTAALEWIAKYGHGRILPEKEDDESLQYFILQQSITNMAAWNALIDRNLGKVPNESKIDLTTTIDLVSVGKRAIEARRALSSATNQIPAGAIPSSWVTAE